MLFGEGHLQKGVEEGGLDIGRRRTAMQAHRPQPTLQAAAECMWPVGEISSEFPGFYIPTWISNWIWATSGRIGPWARLILKELAAGGSLLLEERSGCVKSVSSTG